MKREPYFEHPWFWYILAVLTFIVCCEGARADGSVTVFSHRTGGGGCALNCTDGCTTLAVDSAAIHLGSIAFHTGGVNGYYILNLVDENGSVVGNQRDFTCTSGVCTLGSGGNSLFGVFQASWPTSSTHTYHAVKASGPGSISSGSQTVVSQAKCDGSNVGTLTDVAISVTVGNPGDCTQDVHVTAHWAGILPKSTSTVVNLDVGGILVQVQGNVSGFATATMSAAQLNVIGASPFPVNSAGVMGGSWAMDNNGNKFTPVVVGGYPTTVTCGGTLDIPVSSGIPAPSPTPGATATVSPSTSVTPYPSPTPIPTATVPPFPGPQTPLDNAGTTTTGTPGVGISNQMMYNDFKQALQDSSRTGAPQIGDQGPVSHGEGDYSNRGHIDDLQGQAEQAIEGKTAAVNGVSGVINSYINGISQLSGQTFGNVTSIPMPFVTLGHAPEVGKIELPTSLDLSPWFGLINGLRSCLLWLLRIGFWVLSFRMVASQGATT